MAATLDDKLVVAISSRALFNLEEENQLFESGDPDGYMRLQYERLDVPAQPGIAYSLVQKLLRFNDDGVQRVEVVILSRNDPVSGMRIFRSSETAGIKLQRGVFTQGRAPFGYLRPLRAHLFLSVNAEDVREALHAGFPAARVLVESVKASDAFPNEVRIAFDGDAVLFSDEAERVFQAEGLDAFQLHESSKAQLPLPEGPFKPLLAALHRLQLAGNASMRIRTALVTARSAPAHERAIRTLMNWNVRVDEAMFLGGLPKGEFLREFEPDFFFDDQTGHVDAAARHVPSGHVSSGISNP
ncbi:5'-nucleotidase [Variovorax guangxiensis]|uniref:5'-nucleotidase n=1 Tax=Variovorax guangxiensis TaxID=1775474 RepID=A0A502DT33_9BURK|nr:5'-nucleotidase [Variovorax guangxiensis]RZI69325.1 MAG: 5'-nucleotidase [Variovorax sp.]TPG24318.1 5'-nucleotidase [Variovorax ginsengisoli]TPG28568.1 5'-nucleotidase [Variovorax guangxiensis]